MRLTSPYGLCTLRIPLPPYTYLHPDLNPPPLTPHFRDLIKPSASSSGMVSGEDEEGEAFRVALGVCLGAHAGCGGKEQLVATMQVRGWGGAGLCSLQKVDRVEVWTYGCGS